MAAKLIRRASYEAEDSIEISLREAFEVLEPQLRPPFPLTIPTQEEYVKLNRAIVYGILCEPNLAEVHIKHLHGIITDGYSYFTCMLKKIVNGIYAKLVDSAKGQLIWVTHEMANVLAVGFDGLLVALLRQIVGGDYSDGNMWLCFEMVSLFLSKWNYLVEDQPLVLTSALYVFLRLLSDHYKLPNNSKIEALRQMEIQFCVKMLRENFDLCLKIGRDLVRLLQDVFHIPEFQAIWKDLLLNPREFKIKGFQDILQLYHLETPSGYFLLRITPEMEKQLRFLLGYVKLGSQKRYQVWFTRKFMNLPEGETLLIDIVRFICCVYHPSNEIIQSDIIPRWAVIGWLLKSCRSNYVEANVKLALLYDWLFFDEKVNNIMNIEPAILLMAYSIPKYIDVTQALLEFLFILVENYDIERKDIILKGVSTAFNILLRKGVIQSLDIFTTCDMLSPFLKERLEKILGEMQVSPHKQPKKIPYRILPCSSSMVELPTPLQGELEIDSGGDYPKASDLSFSTLDDQVKCLSPSAVASQMEVDEHGKDLGETSGRFENTGIAT